MNESETLTLIEGVFTKEEAKEILMNLLSSKINFHQMKNFSSQERFGKIDETAMRRIPELNKEIEKLKAILNDDIHNGIQLKIHSEIHISPYTK